MTEKDKVCGLIWDKIKKDTYIEKPELREKGIEFFSDYTYGEKKRDGKNWYRKAKKVLKNQIESTKYYLAQQKKNWEYFGPNNLKWYKAETKNYYAVGWLLETRTEKSLKKEGLL